MSRSYKKNPVRKIRGKSKEEYWSTVRSRTKTVLRSKDPSDIDDELLIDPKDIINDYNYTDTIIIDEDNPKFKRK